LSVSSAADCSRLRLAAACGIVKIAQEPHCIEFVTLEIFQNLSLVMQVALFYFVLLFCSKKSSWSKQQQEHQLQLIAALKLITNNGFENW